MNNPVYAVAILAVVLFTFCHDAATTIPHKSSLADSLNGELTAIADSGIFNGFSVAIVTDKGTLYQNGFGYADVGTKRKYTDSTIQNIGSISKTFIGIALLKAQELGKLKLDDPINKYLPFNVSNPAFPAAQITIRHLATHTSGIADNDFYLLKDYYLKPAQNLNGLPLVFDETQVLNPADSGVSMESFLQNTLMPTGKWHTKSTFLNHKPGERYEYSNTGATLAAYIVQRATGQSFDTFINAHILKPLKMNASGWKFADVDFSTYSTLYATPQTPLPFYTMSSYPDGNFITSVNDLSLYLAELIKGYEGRGTILAQESYKELYRPQLTEKNFEGRNLNNPYSESYNIGIFMGFGYTGYIGHTGGDPGVASMLFFHPKTKTGRILIVNTSFSGKTGNKAFFSIWDALDKYAARLAE